jgi:hypothetical protein
MSIVIRPDHGMRLFSAPGPTVCGSGTAASPGITRAGADGGVHGEAAGQSGAPTTGTGPKHRSGPACAEPPGAEPAVTGRARDSRARRTGPLGRAADRSCVMNVLWPMSFPSRFLIHQPLVGHGSVPGKVCDCVGGVTTPPCGVPAGRAVSVPSSRWIGAVSHRST